MNPGRPAPFFLFGIGDRRKLLYRDGVLREAFTGEVVQRWEVRSARTVAREYRLRLDTPAGTVHLWEDEKAVWLEDADGRCPLTRRPRRAPDQRVNLPRFEGHPNAAVLRGLHHEMLVNVVRGAPVPNLFAYDRPWYRDAAMVCMCLERTRNLHLVRDWVLGLRSPFDYNNGGNAEPDNLGQALYMLSLFAHDGHPLVDIVLDTAATMQHDRHIRGTTDGCSHPVYQTKWLKYGLCALGLEDGYRIPDTEDSYSALFWMGFRNHHREGPRFARQTARRYPYLRWAEAHFYREPPPGELLGYGFPLTWETHASQANYHGLHKVDRDLFESRTAAPHSWHAAEAFLYLLEHPRPGFGSR